MRHVVSNLINYRVGHENNYTVKHWIWKCVPTLGTFFSQILCPLKACGPALSMYTLIKHRLSVRLLHCATKTHILLSLALETFGRVAERHCSALLHALGEWWRLSRRCRCTPKTFARQEASTMCQKLVRMVRVSWMKYCAIWHVTHHRGWHRDIWHRGLRRKGLTNYSAIAGKTGHHFCTRKLETIGGLHSLGIVLLNEHPKCIWRHSLRWIVVLSSKNLRNKWLL